MTEFEKTHEELHAAAQHMEKKAERVVDPAAAATAIPLCVSLIYKHREIETTMWEMIACLATKLRPPTAESVSWLHSGYALVKNGPTTRTIFYKHDYLHLRAIGGDPSIEMDLTPLATLIGDPGENGRGQVHVLIGRHNTGQCRLTNVAAHLRSNGIH